MRVFAIADLHLSYSAPKPMTVFGANWAGHPQLIFERWPEVVGPEDVVLLPGDLSWAMRLPGALEDLSHVAALPGTKVLLRGNHDYWWPAIGKLRQSLPAGMLAIQNDALRIGNLIVSGTRGWVTPGPDSFQDEDRRIYERELERLKLSLESAKRLGAGEVGTRHILMLHYPPTGPNFAPTGFTDLIARAAPDAVVYGHLHGVPVSRSLQHWHSIPTYLVAADGLGFRPKLILEQLPEVGSGA
ncbi:metallophosphoesterase [Deinococcus ruber]|uniref:Phosphohydrolase n=1 Tax=Deinococcus ruber TaxID=1848197 RepID=A0A918BUL5_9DEIO|nr:metallophosphoesterase [Deinococcus ruber]GGQ92972.1 phosphohydrolase [Deinococcus ruber]